MHVFPPGSARKWEKRIRAGGRGRQVHRGGLLHKPGTPVLFKPVFLLLLLLDSGEDPFTAAAGTLVMFNLLK